MQATSMTFTIEPWTDHTVVVHVGKALDFRNAANFKAACQDQVKDGIRNFVLDFSETGRITSYNVCYTKLLRNPSNAQSIPGSDVRLESAKLC